MFGAIKKLANIFPVTTTRAVYLDGTNETLEDAMEKGSLGNIGKKNIIKSEIYPQFEEIQCTRGLHDCTFIGNDYVSFNKLADNGSYYYSDIESKTVVKQGSTNFTESDGTNLEMKSVDYMFGKLVVANGKASYNADFSRMYIFHDVLNWKSMDETITFSNCGNYDEIDITALGYKVYAFWGNADDVLFISCNLFNDIYQIQLGRGTNNFGSGTYTASDTNRYNGSYKILGHWHQNGELGNYAAHGGQYYNGNLYLATNDTTKCMIYKCILEDDGSLFFEPLNFKKMSLTDPTKLYYTYIDGLCIKDGKIYAQPLSHTKMILVADVI